MPSIDLALILEFFACASKLLDAKIVRSDKLLGDIGEWLCTQKYGLILETSGRHPGYDGKIGESRVQVKVHNAPIGTNLNVGDPGKYDELIIILGPRSRLRIVEDSSLFHIYRFTSADVSKLMQRDSGHFCAKGVLAGAVPEIMKIET